MGTKKKPGSKDGGERDRDYTWTTVSFIFTTNQCIHSFSDMMFSLYNVIDNLKLQSEPKAIEQHPTQSPKCKKHDMEYYGEEKR